MNGFFWGGEGVNLNIKSGYFIFLSKDILLTDWEQCSLSELEFINILTHLVLGIIFECGCVTTLKEFWKRIFFDNRFRELMWATVFILLAIQTVSINCNCYFLYKHDTRTRSAFILAVQEKPLQNVS